MFQIFKSPFDQHDKKTFKILSALLSLKRIGSFMVLLLLAISFNYVSASDQIYVNRQFVVVDGHPVNLHWSYSLQASTGHIMTVGNTLTANSGQGANVLLTKQASTGNTLWSVEYDDSLGLDEYGISLCEDSSGNFIVTAAGQDSSGSFDLLVLKYSSSGQLLWDYRFDGNSGDDIPTGIAALGDEVVVTGSTETANNTSDIITMKLDENGNQLWSENYDQNGLLDVPVKIEIEQASGIITVAGGSASQLNVYGKVVLKYSSSGNLLDEYHSPQSLGIDKPTCMSSDGYGNTVLGGYYTQNPGETEMTLISLSDSLDVNWTLSINTSAGEDILTDVVTTYSGESFITGHTETAAGKYVCFIARIGANGQIVWQKAYHYRQGGAMGRRITLDTEGNVNIAGIQFDATDTSLLTLQYDSTGKINFAQSYDNGYSEIATGIISDLTGDIYVSATTSANGNEYMTVKYNTFRRDYYPVDSGDYMFVDDEMIVQFKPAATLSSAFGGTARTFGTLNDFIDPLAIAEINAAFEGQYEFGRFNAVKVFRDLTSDDTTATTRDGGTIRLHHFWSALVVLLPEQLNEYETSLTFNTLRDVVYFAEINRVGTADALPNDSVFVAGGQNGMESSLNPECDIEADRAWDIFTGTDDVRVGIFDTGIKWDHPDMSKTGSQEIADSKVIQGFDYFNNVEFNENYFGDDNGHGTSCAGIIGAIRNNQIGIAGLAGGDAVAGEYGANLLDFKILDFNISFNQSQTKVDLAAEAWIKASRGFEEGGFDIDIMNNSWSLKPGSNLYTQENRSLFFKTNKTVFDLGVINICTRGNNVGNNQVFPGSLGPDQHLICVGANDQSGKRANFSGKGRNLDLVAPGVSNLVTTTNNNLEFLPYDDFSGTSAAAPHVSGVAALLVSNDQMAEHWPTTYLVTEDIENLVEIYATSVDSVPYTDNNGWGRLNAGEVMEHMEWPQYKVKHINGSTSSYTTTQVASSVTIEVMEDFASQGVVEGTYTGNIHRVDVVSSHSIGNATLLNAWVRNGAAHSNMFGDSSEVWDLPDAELLSANSSQASVRGYIFELLTDAQGDPVNEWVPFENGNNAEYSYSLHIYDEEASGLDKTKDTDEASLLVWPNPTDGVQHLSIPEGSDISLELLDAQGRLIKARQIGDAKATQQLGMDLSDLPAGIYHYRIKANEYECTHKIIKTSL